MLQRAPAHLVRFALRGARHFHHLSCAEGSKGDRGGGALGCRNSYVGVTAGNRHSRILLAGKAAPPPAGRGRLEAARRDKGLEMLLRAPARLMGFALRGARHFHHPSCAEGTKGDWGGGALGCLNSYVGVTARNRHSQILQVTRTVMFSHSLHCKYSAPINC